jgi:hypothetical protein
VHVRRFSSSRWIPTAGRKGSKHDMCRTRARVSADRQTAPAASRLTTTNVTHATGTTDVLNFANKSLNFDIRVSHLFSYNYCSPLVVSRISGRASFDRCCYESKSFLGTYDDIFCSLRRTKKITESLKVRVRSSMGHPGLQRSVP